MFEDQYEVTSAPDAATFEFDSVGPRGTVRKVVRYSELDLRNFYNLGFGDRDELTGFVSDVSITNNNDRQKVLATVAATLYAFTDAHPDATIIATGSSEARTRLYRMGIANHLEHIEKDFEVFGLNVHMNWEPFRKNVVYGAFLVHRKMYI